MTKSNAKVQREFEQKLLKFKQSEDFKAWATEVYQDTSDRSVAVLSAAMLDTLLEKILVKTLREDDPERIDKLMGIGGQLNSFGAKILMVYCMGLMNLDAYKDLVQVEKIRNTFAHELMGQAFEVEDCRKYRF